MNVFLFFPLFLFGCTQYAMDQEICKLKKETEALINAGQNLSKLDPAQSPLLNYTLYEHLPHLIEPLLKLGADANAQFDNRVPLHKAIFTDNLQLVSLLLKYNADPNPKFSEDHLEGSLLHSAISMGNKKIIKTLLDHGANPNDQKKVLCRETLLNKIIQHPYKKIDGIARFKLVKLLLQYGAKPELTDRLSGNAYQAAKYHVNYYWADQKYNPKPIASLIFYFWQVKRCFQSLSLKNSQNEEITLPDEICHLLTQYCMYSNDDCAICTEPLVQYHEIQPCKHNLWHKKCISQWLNQQKSCPICRVAILNN